MDHLEQVGIRTEVRKAVNATSSCRARTSAAFCCVTSSIWVTASATCSIRLLCSCDAAAISPMISVTRCTAPMISDIVRLVPPTRVMPVCTRATDVLSNSLISFAAAEERCARLRTAKPRPSSPARAASTAAFSARMFVWNAMPSMIVMISAILAEL